MSGSMAASLCTRTGDDTAVILDHYPWLEPDDVRACLVFARRLVGHERWEPFPIASAS